MSDEAAINADTEVSSEDKTTKEGSEVVDINDILPRYVFLLV